MFLGKGVQAVHCQFMLFQETETQEMVAVPRIAKPCNWYATAAARAKVAEVWLVNKPHAPLSRLTNQIELPPAVQNFEKGDELIWTKSHPLRFSRKCPWRQKEIRPYLWWRDLLPRLSLKSHPFIKSKSFFHQNSLSPQVTITTTKNLCFPNAGSISWALQMPWYHRALRNSWVQGDFQENRMLALGKLNPSVIYSYALNGQQQSLKREGQAMSLSVTLREEYNFHRDS